MASSRDTAGGGPETSATTDAPGSTPGPGNPAGLRLAGPGDAGGAPPAGPRPGGPLPGTVRPDSPRVQLARVAVAAALGCDGVLRLDGGPRDHWSTFAGSERLAGVVVIADDAPGRYAASVYLHARLTDLRALAEEVRGAIRDAASEHGLAERLGEVRIAITDIDDGTTTA